MAIRRSIENGFYPEESFECGNFRKEIKMKKGHVLTEI